jgi:hypothetical protein
MKITQIWFDSDFIYGKDDAGTSINNHYCGIQI